SYYVESSAINGLGKLATGNLDNKQGEIIPILEQILAEKSGWNEIIRSSAINALSQLKTSEKAADIIAKFTDLGIPQPLRLTAIRCLGAIAKGQKSDKLESILGNFEAIMSDTFFLTQMSLISALGQIEDAQAISMLTNLADTTPDGRVKRRAEEAINQVRSKLGSDKTVKDLQQAIDKLKEENQDLQTRLAKLEAK
ncbi:MAG: aminopeptidase, partial [Cyanobacteria bacterium]|nr:aminopeptidase [Cyanobacteria bacterium CG_2015-09_32_10]